MLPIASFRFFAALLAVTGTWHLSQGHEDCTELGQGAVGDTLLQIGQRPLSKEPQESESQLELSTELQESESELELSKELPRLERELEELTGQEPAEPASKQIADDEADNVKNSTDRKNSVNSWLTAMFKADDAEVEVTRDTTTLFYHFHVPKTGGTTVANLMMADLCTPWNVPFKISDNYEKDLCSQGCRTGLTENMLSCYPNRQMFEHVPFSSAVQRAQGLKGWQKAHRIVYVTSLRRGSDRVVSQWAQEVQQGLFIPRDGVTPWSNMSLGIYVSGGAHTGAGWILGRAHVSQRTNMQVAQLASLPKGKEVTKDDLEKAKKVLMAGEWRVGFMECMQQLHEGLEQDAQSLHKFGKNPGRPRMVIPVTNAHAHAPRGAGGIWLDKATKKLVDRKAHFDNELYDWAWKSSQAGAVRFAGTC